MGDPADPGAASDSSSSLVTTYARGQGGDDHGGHRARRPAASPAAAGGARPSARRAPRSERSRSRTAAAEGGRSAGSLARVAAQQLVEPGGERAVVGQLRDRPLAVRRDDLEVRGPGVRRPPGQRRPEQAAERVDVGLGAGLPAGVQLGRHVAGRADGRVRGAGLLAADLAGDAEVGEVGGEPAVGTTAQQHVGRLDVAVHQSGRVRVGQTVGDLLHQVDRDRHRRCAVRAQHRAQVAVGDQLGRDPEPALVLAVRVDLDDVPGVEQRLGLRLAREPGPEVGVLGQPGRDHLQRHRSLEVLVARLEHHAHAATAEAPPDPVVADPLPLARVVGGHAVVTTRRGARIVRTAATTRGPRPCRPRRRGTGTRTRRRCAGGRRRAPAS